MLLCMSRLAGSKPRFPTQNQTRMWGAGTKALGVRGCGLYDPLEREGQLHSSETLWLAWRNL